jgi:hypothetical protein
MAVPIWRNDPALADKDAIAAWEEAYREYEKALATDVVGASRAVAAAWRNLAVDLELPWWLLAAVHSAAEAFDLQAEAWEAASRQAGATDSPMSKEDDTDKAVRRRYTWPPVVIPAARRPRNGHRVRADTTPSGSEDGEGRTESSGDG